MLAIGLGGKLFARLHFAHVEEVAIARGIGCGEEIAIGELAYGGYAMSEEIFGCVEDGTTGGTATWPVGGCIVGGRGGSNVVDLYLFVGSSSGE